MFSVMRGAAVVVTVVPFPTVVVPSSVVPSAVVPLVEPLEIQNQNIFLLKKKNMYIQSNLVIKNGLIGVTLISLINVEVGINVEGGILWKKLMHNSNKRGVEGGKNLKNQ